jgi:hypothetical protein
VELEGWLLFCEREEEEEAAVVVILVVIKGVLAYVAL